MATKKQTVQTFHPAKASRLTDKFGTHSETRKKLGLGPHRGIDYSVASGTQLVAVGTGRVKNMGWTDVLGWFIEINVAVIVKGKVETRVFGYYHLLEDPSTSWKVNDPIKGGQALVKSGNTGSATSGAHLHLMAGKTIGLATKPVEDPEALILASLEPVTVEVEVKSEPKTE